MDEEMRVDLVPVDAELFEELPVLLRDEIEFAIGKEVSVSGQSRVAAAVDPLLEQVVTVAGFEHHEVVIAAQGDELSGFAQLQELLDHTARVRPAVDIIAEQDELVIGAQRD